MAEGGESRWPFWDRGKTLTGIQWLGGHTHITRAALRPHRPVENEMIPHSIMGDPHGAVRVSDHVCRGKNLGVTQVGSSLVLSLSLMCPWSMLPPLSVSGFHYEWGS